MEFKTVKTKGTAETTIKKSRFITHVSPAATEEEALEFIGRIREKHRDAAHNVYAFRVGLTKDLKRQSDDGEPGGTAGKPLLELIEHRDLKNLVVVVTRYFGGVKLGTGGLVRAYSQSGKDGLEQAGVVTKTLFEEMKVVVDYTHLGKIQNEIEEQHWVLLDTEYTDEVAIKVAVMEAEKERFVQYINNLTGGKGQIQPIQTVYMEKPF